MHESGFVPLALGIVQHLMSLPPNPATTFNYRRGNRQAPLARLIRVPTQQRDVLISKGPNVKLNLLFAMRQSKQLLQRGLGTVPAQGHFERASWLRCGTGAMDRCVSRARLAKTSEKGTTPARTCTHTPSQMHRHFFLMAFLKMSKFKADFIEVWQQKGVFG